MAAAPSFWAGHASTSSTLLRPGLANVSTARQYLYRDIHAPDDLLPALAAARHQHGELILLTSNLLQYDLAVNLIASLASIGLDNYILLADNSRLVERARIRGAVAAVWSSLLDRFVVRPAVGGCPAGCVDHDFRASQSQELPPRLDATAELLRVACRKSASSNGARACPPSAAFYRADAVRRLWILRWHYVSRLIGMRYRVLLLDSDSMVLANPCHYSAPTFYELRRLASRT